jgi:hypothetical protein
VVLLGLAAAFGWNDHSFFPSYLVGYMGVLGIVLCALFFTMVQHITRAGWSVTVRRLAENIAWTIGPMLVLFVPVFLGRHHIYHHWMGADLLEDHVLAGKSAWLNEPFFLIRVGIYFAIWIGLAWYFRGKSLEQDETGDARISLRLSRLAAPSLLLFALSISFAAFDWIMSIDPHWFSTIFGITYFAGGYMAFLAFAILLAKWLGRRGYLADAITVEHYHDLGKFLWAFMVFWTYTNFSQYMLIYYANLPEETIWFAQRAVHGWGAVGVILIVGHFLFPFAFGMSRHVKRNGVTLGVFAGLMLVIHNIDMQFLILPSAAAHGGEDAARGAAEPAGFGAQLGEYLHTIGWADFGCFVGLLAIVAGLTILNVRRTCLVPARDPRLPESLHFENL